MTIPETVAIAGGGEHRCGTAAVVGRPNVGKSSLLNALVGERLSITGPKAQTTRHRILGIVTRPSGQILLLDTPGLHRPDARAISRQLNRTVRQVLADADVILHVVEAGRWSDEDEGVWQALSGSPRPKLLVLNKIDLKKDKSTLLPFIAKVSSGRSYDAIIPVSAKAREGLVELERAIIERLPAGPAVHGEDEFTDRNERFLASELVREQLMLRLSQELPYSTTVEIEQFEDKEGTCQIGAVIWVERDGQKSIVIGAGGAQLKAIGTAARHAMERLFDRRVFLRLWVNVRENWSDDEAALRHFGYGE
jgi:GTP-binding protein Era